MKTFKKLFIVILVLSSLRADCQLTLQKTYPSNATDDLFQFAYLKHSGFKFVYLHSDTLSFYSLNLSLYKNIIIPGNWSPGDFSVYCISEGLFDTDTSHIDYMVESNGGDSLKIYNDNGVVIYKEDSAYFAPNLPSMTGSVFYPIITTDSGTFITITRRYGLGIVFGRQLFSLPGSLPCIPDCPLGSGIVSETPYNSSSNGTIIVYPKIRAGC